MRIVMAAFAFIIVIGIAAAVLPTIASESETLRTEDVTETGLACSTGAATSCSITLAQAHAHGNTDHMVVTETSPASTTVTSQTSVGTNRETLTITGLAISTSYIFDVAYAIVDPSLTPGSADVYHVAPMFWFIGFFAVILFAFVGIIKSVVFK